MPVWGTNGTDRFVVLVVAATIWEGGKYTMRRSPQVLRSYCAGPKWAELN